MWTLALASALAAEPIPPAVPVEGVRSLVVDDVRRGGFHFQIAFGIGGGPDTEGLFHAMEIGGTLKRSGVTLGMWHTFVQNKGMLDDKGGPDLVGGWLFQAKIPIVRPEFVAKIGVGPGGLHDQSDGIVALWGPAWAYGFDIHLPVSRRSGPTLGFTVLQTVVGGQHHVTASVGLGYTVF